MRSTFFTPTIESYLKVHPSHLRQTGGLGAAGKIMDPDLPLVSVFTIVRNNKDTLAQTIKSVIAQTYPNIEYLIVDGASTDGTLEIIKQFNDKIDLWISEPDLGTSDATNKAISLSKGRIVSWLASDDWMDPDFIQIAVEALLNSDADFVFGDLKVYEGEHLVSLNKGDKNYEKTILSGSPNLSYPTMVIKRECYERVGLLDLRYAILNDYDWALRAHLLGYRGVYENRLVGNIRLGGISCNSDFRLLFDKTAIMKRHGLLTIGIAIPYFKMLVRYSLGYLARLILTKSIHQKLKHIMIKTRLIS